MDFFKVRRFRKAHKPDLEKDKPVPPPEEPEPNNENGFAGKSVTVDVPELDDDDDDFITNEVKRRLKELRRNSFMMLIPEEAENVEDDEEGEGETCSSEERDTGDQVQHVYYDSDSIYQKYCERMLLFDRISAQQLAEAGPRNPSNPSPRATSKKLTSSFGCLSLKKIEEPEDETEHLQQPDRGPYQDLETAYVAHICLTWEVLHCQYTQLSQKILCQPESPTCYNNSAQQFQQFQVLLQRFIENEPFEEGIRPEIYARTRYSLPKLLQVPYVQGSCEEHVEREEADFLVLAPQLMGVIQSSILTFYMFLKMDKKKPNGVLNIFGSQTQIATPLQQVQSVVEKKRLRLKELRKKKKGSKRKSWPTTHEEVELLFSLIDVKVVSRLVRMDRITKEQLLWCEDKMKKLDLSDGKLQRDPSPILFPC